jgi:DnaJ-class molecular chaperone
MVCKTNQNGNVAITRKPVNEDQDCLDCDGCGLLKGRVCKSCNGHGIIAFDGFRKHVYYPTPEQLHAMEVLGGIA